MLPDEIFPRDFVKNQQMQQLYIQLISYVW
jgi:hypothetical protein